MIDLNGAALLCGLIRFHSHVAKNRLFFVTQNKQSRGTAVLTQRLFSYKQTEPLHHGNSEEENLSAQSAEHMMLPHITRDHLIIIVLTETEPRGAFVLNGETSGLHTDFLQPISQKIYLAKFRDEAFLTRATG